MWLLVFISLIIIKEKPIINHYTGGVPRAEQSHPLLFLLCIFVFKFMVYVVFSYCLYILAEPPLAVVLRLLGFRIQGRRV